MKQAVAASAEADATAMPSEDREKPPSVRRKSSPATSINGKSRCEV